MTEYSKRDIAALDQEGGHYSRHVAAMTEEGLHEKSAIAAELAWRDRRIALLEADAARLRNCLTDGEQPVELVRHGPDSHSGPGWYWYATEYPEEGSVGAFASRAEALESILSNDSELSTQSQQALAGELDRADAHIERLERERDEARAEWSRRYSEETIATYASVLEAAFPDDSTALVAALKDLWKNVHCDLSGELRGPHTMVGKLRLRIARLEETVRWYADPKNHEKTRRDIFTVSEVDVDQGERACRALNDKEEENDG